MIVFAASGKGGTGRTVTSCNVAYRLAMQGNNVAYLDFDFGFPAAGAVFDILKAERGVEGSGLHSYFTHGSEPLQLNVARHSERIALSDLQSIPTAGRLVLLPGERGGGEYFRGNDVPAKCAELLLRLDNEFDVCVVDLSAGNSYAVELVLQATARAEMSSLVTRWLVYHRWTRQHIIAADGLVRGDEGLITAARVCGHDPETLANSLRYVRTAVVDLNTRHLSVERTPQEGWLLAYDQKLQEFADRLTMGWAWLAGQIPFDPVLQWREQVIADTDASRLRIALQATVDAFESLARCLSDDTMWNLTNHHRAYSERDSSTLTTWATAGEVPGDPELHPARIYIDEEQEHGAVEEALRGVLEAFGLGVVQAGDPVIGSWFREFFIRSKREVADSDMFAMIERAIEMKTHLGPQAQIDANQANAVASLITSLASVSNAVVQIGSVLLIKTGGDLRVVNLTQRELAEYERDPSRFRDPASALRLVQWLADSTDDLAGTEGHRAAELRSDDDTDGSRVVGRRAQQLAIGTTAGPKASGLPDDDTSS